MVVERPSGIVGGPAAIIINTLLYVSINPLNVEFSTSAWDFAAEPGFTAFPEIDTFWPGPVEPRAGTDRFGAVVGAVGEPEPGLNAAFHIVDNLEGFEPDGSSQCNSNIKSIRPKTHFCASFMNLVP
jgi:hypothetical protein